MYQIYCDGSLLYDPRVEELALVSPSLSLELNKTGSFTFTLYPTHPLFGSIQRLKSVVEVQKDGSPLFRGRVISEKAGFYNQVSYTCEGVLAYLLDSRIQPFSFSGTVAEFLEEILSLHNAFVQDSGRSFQLGNVTVSPPDGEFSCNCDTYESTWNLLTTRLVDTLGGYLSVRFSAEGLLLDYLEEYGQMTEQTIRFGENLLDYSKSLNSDAVITALIPLGSRLASSASLPSGEETDPAPEQTGLVPQENRVTIAEVNGGKDYLFDSDAVERYGWILGTQTWENVTEPGELLVKGREYLEESLLTAAEISISAADLSQMDASYDDFRLGQTVYVDSPPHGLHSEPYLISRLTINILEPAQNTLTLGKAYSTFTDTAHRQNQNLSQLATAVEKVEQNYVTNEAVTTVTNELSSRIDQSANEILSTVSAAYATADGVREEVSTQIMQNSQQIEFRFESMGTELSEINQSMETQFSEISKYIRYADGKIILGVEGDPLTCQIANNRLSFLQNGSEVAYISDNRLHIKDSEIKNRLSLGKPENGHFDWIPRTNGNLSLTWREPGTEVE